jgi:sugar lactone lactonase YvrE
MVRRLTLVVFGLVLVGATRAEAVRLSPGDVLAASDDQVHHYSASEADLGIFASDLSTASWITVDQAANVYVTEYTGNRVRKFSPNGDGLLTITTTYTPGGVAVGTDGSIYVAHYDAGKIQRYSATGADLGVFASYAGCDTGCGTDFIRFGPDGNLYVADFRPLGRVRLISSTGIDLGDFVTTNVPGGVEGLAFDAQGNLYISNFEHRRLRPREFLSIRRRH